MSAENACTLFDTSTHDPGHVVGRLEDQERRDPQLGAAESVAYLGENLRVTFFVGIPCCDLRIHGQIPRMAQRRTSKHFPRLPRFVWFTRFELLGHKMVGHI